MSTIPIVLDTGVFFVPAALGRLAEVPEDVLVPPVVVAERARQLAKNGVPPSQLLEALEANTFDVHPFGVEEALRWAPDILDDDAWRRLARDALIAGHVSAENVLWTTNPADFEEIGVPAERIAEIVPPGG